MKRPFVQRVQAVNAACPSDIPTASKVIGLTPWYHGDWVQVTLILASSGPKAEEQGRKKRYQSREVILALCGDTARHKGKRVEHVGFSCLSGFGDSLGDPGYGMATCQHLTKMLL